MATTNYVLITDDFYNELEEYTIDALEGDRAAAAVIRDFGHSLSEAIKDLTDPELKLDASNSFITVQEWLDRGGSIHEFDSEDETFDEEIVGPLEGIVQNLGDLLVPLAGDGYDPQMELGRVSIDQIPEYSADRPQVTLAGVRYSFVDIPEENR